MEATEAKIIKVIMSYEEYVKHGRTQVPMKPMKPGPVEITLDESNRHLVLVSQAKELPAHMTNQIPALEPILISSTP